MRIEIAGIHCSRPSPSIFANVSNQRWTVRRLANSLVPRLLVKKVLTSGLATRLACERRYSEVTTLGMKPLNKVVISKPFNKATVSNPTTTAVILASVKSDRPSCTRKQ